MRFCLKGAAIHCDDPSVTRHQVRHHDIAKRVGVVPPGLRGLNPSLAAATVEMRLRFAVVLSEGGMAADGATS
jgi:hypothetical protein